MRLVIVGALVAAVAVTGSAVAAVQVLAPKKITVSATEYAYKFSTTKTARKNQKVVITLVNRGTEVHDLKFNGAVNSPTLLIAEMTLSGKEAAGS